MNILKYKQELLDILSFVESAILQDIKDYLNDSDISLLDFQKIEYINIIYESNELKITKEKVTADSQSLCKARDFILFLLHKNRISKLLAQKITFIEEFYSLFSLQEVLKILFIAEKYEECQKYYCRHISDFADSSYACSLWQRSLSRIGNYTRTIDIGLEEFDVYLSAMRYLWQKGDFFTAKQIIDKLDQNLRSLKAYQECLYLNTKIRVLRDMGKIKETNKLLRQFNALLKTVGSENPEYFNDLNGKYLYNCSINFFISGDFAKCISFCKESLPLRSDKYPDPYIRLREARCYIFQGKQKDYLSLMRAIQFESLDKWAKSLYKTVQAEYCHYILGNTSRTESVLKESNKLEIETGADTIYTDIALLYLYVQCGKENEINRYLATVKKYKYYIDAKLSTLTAGIALSALKGELVNERILKICRDFKDYPAFLFVSLFSLCRLFEQRNLDFPDIRESVSFIRGFSRKLISSLSPKPHILIIYSWWNVDGENDIENQEWVENLNIALHKHGIISDMDKTLLDETIDSSKLICGNYNSYIVVLNDGFKERINQQKGILFEEYKVLLEKIKLDPNQVILIRRGENDNVSPKEMKTLTKLDLSAAELSKKNDKQLLGLVRRIQRIPYYDKTVSLVDEDLVPEPLK